MLFLVVHVSNLRSVGNFSYRPTNASRVTEVERVNLNEANIQENSFKTELEENMNWNEWHRWCEIRFKDALKLSKSTKCCLLENYRDSYLYKESDLYYAALLLDSDFFRVSRTWSDAIQSDKEGLQDYQF